MAHWLGCERGTCFHCCINATEVEISGSLAVLASTADEYK